MPCNRTVVLPRWFTTLYPTTSRRRTPTSLAILNKHNKLHGELRDHIFSAEGVFTNVTLELQSTDLEIVQQARAISNELNRITARFINEGVEDIKGIAVEDLKEVEDECVKLAKQVKKEEPRVVREQPIVPYEELLLDDMDYDF